MVGEIFHRLTVISAQGKNKHGKLMWECLCECGKSVTTLGVYLRNGDTKSCGCYGLEQRIKSRKIHGRSHKNDGEYEIWKGMKARCLNPNRESYPKYGGRGIRVCDRWKHSFVHFLEDMGLRPSPEHSLDRYPNNENGHYEPGNVRWATEEQQSRNKRNNRWYEYNGEKLVLADWATKFNVNPSTLSEQLETKTFDQVYAFYTKKITKEIGSQLTFTD